MNTNTSTPQTAPKPHAAEAPMHENPALIPAQDISGFKMVDNLPNPVGWDVIADDGVNVGTVARILVQRNEKAIRYFELSLKKSSNGGRTLIPVGLFQEWPDKKQLTMRMPSAAVLATGPRLENDIITAETEARFVKAFGAGASLPDGPDRYKHPVFDVDSLAGRKQPEQMS